MELPSLEGQGAIGVDLETCDPLLRERGPGYHRPGTFVAGVAVGTESGFRAYYSLRHEGGENADPAVVLPWLKGELARSVPKVGSNISYDLGFLSQEGIYPEPPFYDTQIAEPLLDDNRLRYGIDALGQSYLGAGKSSDEMKFYLETKFGKKNPLSSIWRAPGDLVAPYAINDVDLSLRVFALQRKKLEMEGLWGLFLLECRLIPLLIAMRKRGVRVDLDRAEQTLVRVSDRFEEVLDEVDRLAGYRPDVWAASSLEKLFTGIGIVDFPRTPKLRAPSFTAAWLEACSHRVAALVLEARKLDKLRGTFIEGSVLEMSEDGRVHCQFHQLKGESGGAVSGRFSCSSPNPQFIPKRTKLGREIRTMFLPDEGEDFVREDWSQIEYRLIVADAAAYGLPGAAELAERYRADPSTDAHQAIADMCGMLRDPAKTINFGLAYGEGAVKLCRQLGLSRDDGEALLARYHRGAPFMKPLLQGYSRMAKVEGVVKTLLGRKRRFETWVVKRRVGGEWLDVFLPHRVAGARRAFTHAGLNARIQGSAADIMKKAMVDIWESGVCDVLGPPLLTVHDELDWTVPRTRAAREALQETVRIMETCVDVGVPLLVDVESGENWGEMTPYDWQDGIARDD